MTEDQHKETDPREAVEGPGDSKLAPEGNSNARLFVPGDQDEKRQERDLEEGEDHAGGRHD